MCSCDPDGGIPAIIELRRTLAVLMTNTPRAEILRLLRLVPEARDEFVRLEIETLQTARLAGATWTQIAESLGMHSRQHSQQRYQALLRKIDR